MKLLAVPYRYLYPAILIFCLIGVYSISNNVFDVYITMVFAVVGYLCAKLGLEPAPLLLGYILGPMMEEHLRRALLLGHGDPMRVLHQPDLGDVAGRGRTGAWRLRPAGPAEEEGRGVVDLRRAPGFASWLTNCWYAFFSSVSQVA